MPLDLIELTVAHINATKPPGAILVFLPGWDDISKLHKQLTNSDRVSRAGRTIVLPCHGSMPTSDQRKIFQRPPEGVRKVVLATNIAETSITIDDVVYVIDSGARRATPVCFCQATMSITSPLPPAPGKHKEKTYDPTTNVECLLPTWVSRASATQRKGRAGRVQAGVAFHLFPTAQWTDMAEYQLPEMLRTPLEQLCLQVRSRRARRIPQRGTHPPPPLPPSVRSSSCACASLVPAAWLASSPSAWTPRRSRRWATRWSCCSVWAHSRRKSLLPRSVRWQPGARGCQGGQRVYLQSSRLVFATLPGCFLSLA